MSSSSAAHAHASVAFEIHLVWSDTVLVVNPDESALAVLMAAGVSVDPGCGTGGCGMCMTAYVEGEVVHKDACLSPAERARYFCPCVSRARGRLVLPV